MSFTVVKAIIGSYVFPPERSFQCGQFDYD